ncbi:MAG: ribosome-associated translation inhibitor RaiA [Gammaproteobacteria bacterium]|nr:ribosome-associated translation inhibitor RaiA [Gammaproteobacteria bacterium]
MQISISGHHIEITDALRSYVHSKLERLERHFDQITNMHVILSVEKHQQKAESTIHAGGAEVYADAESDDLYAAIDQLADKLDRQLIKKKEKARNHKQRTPR